jgi:fatty aldehyde-generating acyl-ACP reductase
MVSAQGHQVRGLYIDAFIPPGELGTHFLRQNLARVRAAAACAVREGARIVALGGFSSILLEGRMDILSAHSETPFTTGNTLTVALIVKGVERALALAGRNLRESSVLVIGASGDVGSGCARCLASRVKQLLLSARNPDRLRKHLVPKADVVICVASMPASELFLETLPDGAIVCDAGYPKNLSPRFVPRGSTIFHGGLGEATGGIQLDPDLLHIIYPYPLGNIVHGCLLEGMALAMEKRFEPFSRGRGLITPPRVEEIWQIAQTHGMRLPPLLNSEGVAEEDMVRLGREVAR